MPDEPRYYDERKARDMYPGYPIDSDAPAATDAAESCAMADGVRGPGPDAPPMSLAAALELARLQRERDEARAVITAARAAVGLPVEDPDAMLVTEITRIRREHAEYAYRADGWVQCEVCGTWGDPATMTAYEDGVFTCQEHSDSANDAP